MNPTDQEDLKQFLVYAAKNGYANPESEKDHQPDGSDTIILTRGDWKFRDNYFTSSDSRRFYGHEVVYKQNKPFWYMGYAGFVQADAEPDEVKATFDFMRLALLEPDEDTPLRGPLELTTPDWQYVFIPGDSLEEFYAAEWIKHDGANVYLAHLHGGLVA